MSTYKAVVRSDELYHFNKKHDRLGRFDTGDGDGDGIADDHAHRAGKRVFNAYKKVTSNTSMVNYATQKAADTRKETSARTKKVKTPAQQKSSTGVKQLIGGLAMIPVGGFLMNSDNELAQAAGWLTGMSGLVISTVGAYNIDRGHRMRDTERAIDYFKSSQ